MKQYTLPINEILVEDRQRIDLGEITDLAESIRQFGLIQPLVVTQNKRLIAGGRRLQACVSLGLQHVAVVYRETMSEEELTCLELEENIRRKDMTWKEEVASVYKIHKLKAKSAAADGDQWTQDQTGRMLGVSRASVGFTIQVAKELLRQDSKIHGCESYTEALRWCFQQREDEIQADLARGMKAQMVVNQGQRPAAQAVNTATPQVSPEGDIIEVVPVTNSSDMVVDLTNTIVNMDSIDWMRNRDAESIDHIITDPPYAVDLVMFEQNNPHGGMSNIDRIEETHQVAPNLILLGAFLEQAHRVLKSNGFCILFCDQMNWQFLYDKAIGVGFRVQRWPFIWHKTHACMNQRAEFNFTKNFEIAMICRKPSSTLVQPVPSSIFSCCSTGYTSNPFAKPLELWSHLIRAVSIQGQTILDPFAGEGSCPNAVMSNWRFPIAIEIDPKHYNVMLDSVRDQYNLFYRKPTFV